MSLNATPKSERVHIGFFGKRNAGKSSVVNAVTNQQLSVVSDVKGTTTDPVQKAMELLPIGPVLIIDTPGFDDEGKLGELRIKKTREVLRKTDIAVLVVDVTAGLTDVDNQLISIFNDEKIPYIIVYNKCDLGDKGNLTENEIVVSATQNININELKEKLAHMTKQEEEKHLVADLVNEGDFVILVVPIDESAPKGRLILPQQQTIRDLLEAGAVPVVCRDTELGHTINSIGKTPAMVITDSQAFGEVSKIVPENVTLTSFSILMARYKGFLESAVDGASALKNLKSGDKILIAEGCTHHRQCNDIGSVKIPRWIKGFAGEDVQIDLSSGVGFPEDLSQYKLVIHCGGCMLNEREVQYRMKSAKKQGVPFLNYGIAIAYMKGILKRSIKPFSDLYNKL